MAFLYPPTMPPTTIGSRRPRWKHRIQLGFFFTAPGTQTVVNPVIWYGMKRLFIQRVKRRQGWTLETYWGSPVSKDG